ncbi:hypothetical protein BDN72DRAFT_901089 [Pluteus cervinus]|uniref:Uncharacterized protein n=1 Tax=Pluteus cervinus TaxID=181527 RepID=A0ACD3AGI3_9AGAR|nr:hypothetical protein BDN72DRAFT_901089 [Pluteus cervinus]
MSSSVSGNSRATEILVDPYLLREIFENFNCGSWSDKRSDEGMKSNAQLLHIALVCKAFTGPALDVLWHTIDSFILLCYTLSSLQRQSGQWVLTSRGLTSKDVTRFKSYAKRVRVVVTNISSGSPLDGLLADSMDFRRSKLSKVTLKTIFTRLREKVPAFFPNVLQVIATNILEPAFYPILLPALATPSLRQFYLMCALPAPPWRQALIRTSARCLPSMKGLKLLDISSEDGDELYPCLREMHSLETLKLGTLKNMPSLELLGNLRSLTRLEIWRTGPYKLKEPSSSGVTAPSLWFPSLEELIGWGGTLDIAMLLGAIRSKALRKMYIVVAPPAPNEDMIKLLDKAMSKWGDSLVDLGIKTITRAYMPNEFQKFRTIPFSQLDSILPSLRSLQKVQLDLQPMSNVNFSAFAAALPNAQAIKLVDFNVAKFEDLRTFSKSCPHLRELTVPVDCKEVCSTAREPDAEASSCSLVSLFVGTSTYSLEPVKESLRSIFPDIREISAFKDESPHAGLGTEELFEATSAEMTLGKWKPDNSILV